MHLSSEYGNDLSSSLSWENLFTKSVCSRNQLGEHCLKEFYCGSIIRINFSVGHVYMSQKQGSY